MKKLLYILVSFLLLTSCSKTTKEKLGLTENMPDELQVTKVKSLEVPPHFDNSNIVVKPVIKKTDKLTKAEKALLEESSN